MALINKTGVKAVGAAAGTIEVTFSSDEIAENKAAFNAGLTLIPVVLPDWATSFYVSALSNTAMTITFGTVAGEYGGSLYWRVTGKS